MRGGAPYALVFLAYLGARAAAHAAVEEPLLDFDSGIYFTMAELALTDIRFWAGDRPWTLPLVLKLLPADARSITWFQLAASAAASGRARARSPPIVGAGLPGLEGRRSGAPPGPSIGGRERIGQRYSMV
ncbi:MAG: hypothetical protein WED01_11555 [Candidatus Rokuibacteriota bacterium]